MLKTYVSAIKKVFQALGAAQSDLLLTIREVGNAFAGKICLYQDYLVVRSRGASLYRGVD